MGIASDGPGGISIPAHSAASDREFLDVSPRQLLFPANAMGTHWLLQPPLVARYDCRNRLDTTQDRLARTVGAGNLRKAWWDSAAVTLPHEPDHCFTSPFGLLPERTVRPPIGSRHTILNSRFASQIPIMNSYSESLTSVHVAINQDHTRSATKELKSLQC